MLNISNFQMMKWVDFDRHQQSLNDYTTEKQTYITSAVQGPFMQSNKTFFSHRDLHWKADFSGK